MAAKQKLLVYCGAYLATIWIVASIPLAFVLYEFGNIPLCNTTLGWFAATLYGSFFIYPLSIGGLSMAALLLPLATTVSLVKRSRRVTAVLLSFYILTTIIIAFFEFSSSPYAVFEIRPNLLTPASPLITGIQAACTGTKYTTYQETLKALIQPGRSYTAWAYYAGFVAQTLMQNALFVVFIAFIYYSKEKIIRATPYLKSMVFYILGYAIFLGSIWCLFRLTYRNEMTALFGHITRFGGDYAIVALYGIVLMVFVAYFEFGLEKLAKTLAQLGQFLVFALGVVAVHQDQGSFFFGRNASVANILVLFVLFVFISALVLAFLLKGSDKK